MMARLLLMAVIFLFILWRLRRFFRVFLLGEAPPVRKSAAEKNRNRRQYLDLARDEKTGEYRVRDD